MATETFYDEDFRSIGQALEAKNIRVFELRRLGDWYIVTAVAESDARSDQRCAIFSCGSAADLTLSH